MKIYIWNNPYAVAYGGSFLFIAAENEEQARKLATSTPVIRFGFGSGDTIIGDLELGPPTRVIDAPGGECYEWEE